MNTVSSISAAFFNFLNTSLKKLGIRRRVYVFFIIGFLAILPFYFYIRSTSELSYDKETYIIARDPTWYAIDLLGKKRQLTAFTNTFFNFISKKSGLHFKWLESHPSRLMVNLDQGICDAILVKSNGEEINQKAYLVSEILIETGPILVVDQKSNVHSLEELRNRLVGISIGGPSFSSALLNERAHANQVQLVAYPNDNKAVEALVQEEVDAVILNKIAAYTLTEGLYRDQIKVVSTPFITEGLRLITLRNEDGKILIDKFNEVLNELKADGSYDKLLDKWGFGVAL